MINEQAAMLKMSSLSYGWSNEQAAMLEMSSLSLWWSRRLCWYEQAAMLVAHGILVSPQVL